MIRSMAVKLFATFVVAVSMLALPLQARAVQCTLFSGTCTLTATTSVWTGTPTIICQAGIDVIRIDVTTTCDFCQQSTYFLRCANSSTLITYNACGYNLVIKLKSGKTWADALTDCNAYSGYES